ncbi:hypothetical protein OJ253_1922 [Cryptosporidium canis]|uniref:Uncharacterized protein n=1 Tax=Cryptosporidium canis TaxID=195482 RepID=A0A9D5HV63_9CRYT|nr:hypothetical protein OJ253_1922 [Cryptosporidium canis]
MINISGPPVTALEELLRENEYIKENFKKCSLAVLDSDGQEKYVISDQDLLITENRILLAKDTEYTTLTSKIPTRFSCERYINISSIVVNAVSSCESDDEAPYLYMQLASSETVDEAYEDLEQSLHFSEVNIHCSDRNTVYTLFNSISEAAAYIEQLSGLSDSQTDNESAVCQD